MVEHGRWTIHGVVLLAAGLGMSLGCDADPPMLDGGAGAADSAIADAGAADAGAADTGAADAALPDAGTAGFVVTGVSGSDVLLDRLWDRGCIPGTGGNDWTAASRTLIGLELTFRLVDFQNGSATPDCENGRVGMATFTIELTDDEMLLPIVWVDPTGAEAAAPAGLESVTMANAATGLMTAATITPETAARATQLNGAAFCGATDWTAGVGREAVACLTGGFNPFKATLVVDDRAMPWQIYDSVGTMFNADGYPVDIANYLPHRGPFPLR